MNLQRSLRDDMEVHQSDLEKVLDALKNAAEHHVYRDRMNGSLHLAKEVRFSPLTSELIAARERVEALLEAAAKEGR